jgi:hypothetical protein
MIQRIFQKLLIDDVHIVVYEHPDALVCSLSHLLLPLLQPYSHFFNY